MQLVREREEKENMVSDDGGGDDDVLVSSPIQTPGPTDAGIQVCPEYAIAVIQYCSPSATVGNSNMCQYSL